MPRHINPVEALELDAGSTIPGLNLASRIAFGAARRIIDVPARGLDRLKPEPNYSAQQERLGELDGVALVPTFGRNERVLTRQRRYEELLPKLRGARTLEAGGVVGIQAMAFETTHEEDISDLMEWYREFSHTILAEMPVGSVLTDMEKPSLVSGKQADLSFYSAIHEALAYAEPGESSRVTSLIVVANPAFAIHTLKKVKYDDLEYGRVAALQSVEQRPQDNPWTTKVPRVLPPEHYEPEPVKVVSTPAETEPSLSEESTQEQELTPVS